jgi:hypothetical protein
LDACLAADFLFVLSYGSVGQPAVITTGTAAVRRGESVVCTCIAYI